MLVIAHRGASADAPENTQAAFALAIEQGADMIETDLHLLRSGEIALHHDGVVQRRPLAQLSLDELRSLRPDAPTLAETLAEFGQRLPFNLEIKVAQGRAYAGLEERTLALVREHGVLDGTVFSSFRDSVLAHVRKLEPRARIGLLIAPRSAQDAEERARSLNAEAIHLDRRLVTPERIAALHGLGLHVRVYTVDDPAEQASLVDSGVEGIFTNTPGTLRHLLLERGRSGPFPGGQC